MSGLYFRGKGTYAKAFAQPPLGFPGGLLLRAASAQTELEYAALAGANRHGKRPRKLAPRSWGYKLLEGTTELDAAKSSTASH